MVGVGVIKFFFFKLLHLHWSIVSPSLEKFFIFGGGGGGGLHFHLHMNFLTLIFSTYDLCDRDILQIYFLFAPSHKRPFSKMATRAAFGHNIL